MGNSTFTSDMNMMTA